MAEQPGIAVTPSGTLLVTFSSIRTPAAPGCSSADDADPGNPYGVRYANSTDGGETFGPNLRINDVDFDATTFLAPNAAGFGSVEFDQVNGIDSTNTGAVGAWGDARNAPTSVSTISDVFSTRIGFVRPAAPPPPPRPPVNPQPAAPFAGCPALTARVTRGTAAAETITGTTAGDRSGNDRLRGNGGNDRIDAGRGNDSAFGDGGNDLITARDNQRDRISCGRGRDRVIADRFDRVSIDCERVRRSR